MPPSAPRQNAEPRGDPALGISQRYAPVPLGIFGRKRGDKSRDKRVTIPELMDEYLGPPPGLDPPGTISMIDPVAYRKFAEAVADAQKRGLLIEEADEPEQSSN